MNVLDSPPTASSSLEQIYLLERDSNLLCRVLGLYAARGMELLRVDYSYAARDVMKLHVSVDAKRGETEEIVRVLVDKVSTFIGVVAACEKAPAERWAA